MASWVSEVKAIGLDFATAVTDQRWAVDSHLTTSASISSAGMSSSLDNLSDEVKNQELSDPVFEVHNELVGDKIYTVVKEKEEREQSKDDFFIYAT